MVLRKKSKTRKKIFVLVSITLLFILTYVSISNQKSSLSPLQHILMLPELSTEGFVEVKPDAAIVGDSAAVSLTGGCYQLTATTEPSQALSIINGLAGKIDFRPNTHDIMKTIFDNLDIKLLMVKIIDLRNNTYFGKIILQQGDKFLNLDSRPSDGIALAIRMNASIYIKEDLLKQGRYIC